MSGKKDTVKSASVQSQAKKRFVSAPAVEIQAGVLVPSYLQEPCSAMGFKLIPYPDKPGFSTFEIISRIGPDELHKLLTSPHTAPATDDPPELAGSSSDSDDDGPMDLDIEEDVPASKKKRKIPETQMIDDG